MPLFERGDVTLHYEEYGSGYPVLLFAPGGLMSTIEAWTMKGPAPYDPRVELAGDFRLIAMDQRNAGTSRAPITANDGWPTLTEDHLALIEHLGIDTLHLYGSCIGCSLAFSLMRAIPDRISSAVLQQPVGRSKENVPQSQAQVRRWADSLSPERALEPAVVDSIYRNLYSTDFVFSVTREFVGSCTIPLLVLPGEDISHPREISLEVAELAPHSTVLEGWKSGSPEVIDHVRQFLLANRPPQ